MGLPHKPCCNSSTNQRTSKLFDVKTRSFPLRLQQLDIHRFLGVEGGCCQLVCRRLLHQDFLLRCSSMPTRDCRGPGMLPRYWRNNKLEVRGLVSAPCWVVD